MEEIRWRLDDLESLSVAHIDRKANGIADCFAKFVVSSFCNDMFFSSVPFFAYESIMHDVISLSNPFGC